MNIVVLPESGVLSIQWANVCKVLKAKSLEPTGGGGGCGRYEPPSLSMGRDLPAMRAVAKWEDKPECPSVMVAIAAWLAYAFFQH